jgi:hypothetical protein
LLESVERLDEATDVFLFAGLNKSFGLSYIKLLIEFTIKKSSFDVERHELEIQCCGNRYQDAERVMFDDRCIDLGLLVVNAGLLRETLCHEAGLVDFGFILVSGFNFESPSAVN